MNCCCSRKEQHYSSSNSATVRYWLPSRHAPLCARLDSLGCVCHDCSTLRLSQWETNQADGGGIIFESPVIGGLVLLSAPLHLVFECDSKTSHCYVVTWRGGERRGGEGGRERKHRISLFFPVQFVACICRQAAVYGQTPLVCDTPPTHQSAVFTSGHREYRPYSTKHTFS